MKKKLPRKFVIEHMKTEIRLFKWDFTSKEYGEKAKLLHKHYKIILDLIRRME